VAIGETHGSQQLHELLVELVRHPAIRAQTHTLAVEVGSTAQDEIDRYLAGSGSDGELLSALRDATFSETGAADPATIDLYRAVRDTNRDADAQWRIVAVDSPLSWADIQTPDGLERFDREADMAAALDELVDGGTTVLWIVGGAHLRPGMIDGPHRTTVGTARALFERDHPGQVFVAELYTGFGDRTAELEARLGSISAPSLLLTARSWLADLDVELGAPDAPTDILTGGPDGAASPAGSTAPPAALAGVDALLYLGACDSLTPREPASDAFADPTYVAELDRRLTLSGDGPFDEAEYRSFLHSLFGSCD
jgi:hypothetical protein